MNMINDVPDDAYDKIRLLSRAWKVSDGAVVERLVADFAGSAADDRPAIAQTVGAVPIYVVYEATRIDALFDPATKAVTITSGKLKDKVYSTPSGAAVAVVSAYNPTINPNRNGWTFWFQGGNGELLQKIRK